MFDEPCPVCMRAKSDAEAGGAARHTTNGQNTVRVWSLATLAIYVREARIILLD